MAAKDITKLQIGHYNATFDGTALGYTREGSTFEYDPQYAPIRVDDYGETPVDYRGAGERVSVKIRLAQNDLATMAEAFPQATAAAERIDGGAIAGASMRAKAGVLHLTPAISGMGEDVTLWKAVCISKITLDYKINDQFVYELEFVGLPDTNKAEGKQLFTIGDTTA